MHFTPFFFLAAVICLHTVAGNTAEARILESESDGAYRYGTPNYIDDSVFDSALQHPNATGTVSFTGRNVSASYSSRDVNGWTLRVNVTSGIIKPGSDDRQLTGSAISILQPAGLPTSGGNNGTDGFQVCVNIMRIVLNMTTNYTQLATDDAGTCGSYMSEECRNELRDLAVSRFQENETCSYNNDPPPSCGNIIFNPAATRFNEADFGLPVTFYQQAWTAFTYGSDPPVATDNKTLVLEDYNTMSTLVYPVLVTYEITNISTLASGISAYSSLACVSATDFTEGSRVPGVGEHTSDGTNSGAYVRMNMGLIGGLVAATALAIMM